MPIAGSPKKLAQDIADGFFSLSPPQLRQYTPAELKTIQTHLTLVARDLRGQQVPLDDLPAIKAKQMLAAAGHKNGLTLTLLYRPTSSIQAKMAQTLQSDLSTIGVKVKLLTATPSDFYVKYLFAPSVAKRGTWDMALAGWGPDWYGDAAVSFFGPLFSGPASYPPSGSNYGFYNDPAVTALFQQGNSAGSLSDAAAIWGKADQMVMKDSPIYPITDPQQPLYHASYVHNAVYIPAIQQFDPTNVWLSPPG